ncbi:MAG: integrase, partial [Gammaproteobacteria bacterium]
TGTPAPVRGGGPVDQDLDRQARLRVARIAGHARLRSAGAYLGQSAVMRRKSAPRAPDLKEVAPGST